MERQHGLNNQLRNLFRSHPNMIGEPSPVHIVGVLGGVLGSWVASSLAEYGMDKSYQK